jgi:4a-hydroxytetrahydrobiopterin dehydratase
MTTRTTLTFADVDAADLPDWRWLLGVLHAHFATGDFGTGLQLVNEIGALAEEANHHPDIELQYPHVRVKLMSHDVSGVTSRDLELARSISGKARELGITAEPSLLSVLEIGLDTADEEAIRPFWGAVLGVEASAEELPTLWFQKTDPHPQPRQRFHLDITVPPDVAEQRIDAALAAGGVLVSDDQAPAFTVLADAEGNRACISTALGRDSAGVPVVETRVPDGGTPGTLA